MTQLVQPQGQIQPTTVQAQWVQYITPVLVGIMFCVLIAGMVRDLFKGEEVKLPLEVLEVVKK